MNPKAAKKPNPIEVKTSKRLNEEARYVADNPKLKTYNDAISRCRKSKIEPNTASGKIIR